MFSFAERRPPRRPSLTPMIDVVFLLLVFFMLVSQAGRDRALPLTGGGADGAWEGPPRLVGIAPDGLTLNGVAVTSDALPGALEALTADPADPVVLRGIDSADLQRLSDIAGMLAGAGFERLVLVE
ncbi:MAG: ExbD/TolR family protein [Paracoccaceae bacterium]